MTEELPVVEYLPARRPNYGFEYTPDMAQTLFEVFENGGFLEEACIAIGCPNTDKFYQQLHKNQYLQQDYEYAKMLGRNCYQKYIQWASRGFDDKGNKFEGNAKVLLTTMRIRYPKDWREEVANTGLSINLNVSSSDIKEKIQHKLENNPQLLEALNGLLQKQDV